MRQNSHYGIKFVLTVAMPLLLAMLGVVGLSQDLLERVSTGANIADHERSRQIVTSAVETAKQRLANTVADNAHWNDAVRNAYGVNSQHWAREAWGNSTTDGTNYEGAFLVDPDSPKAIAAFTDGRQIDIDIEDYFSGGLAQLLAKLPESGEDFAAASAVMMTRGGLAIVAAGPIVPATRNSPHVPASQLRYLVLMKRLSPDYVASIGKQYVIDDLKLADIDDAPATSLKIAGQDGKTVAALSWLDRLPGDIARKQVWRKTVIVLSYLGLVILCVALLCWQLIHRMAKREVEAVRNALCDPLTGLPNRNALQEEVSSLSAEFGAKFSVAFTDLDGFKEVNDTYDHETGDRLIKAVAAALLHLAAKDGKVFRLGGDEFVALFPGDETGDRARSFAANLIEMLGWPIDIDGKMAAVGASVGIVTADICGMDVQEIMRRADIAMYKAKAAGKNRYRVFVSDFDAERHETLAIADELRRIIAARSIEIGYQPIVNAKTRQITGVEALARWPSASARRVSPDRFVRVAETCGLIDDLGESILRQACTDAQGWPGLLISVNISPIQLRNANFAVRMLKIVKSSGIDPRNVELEITEGTLVHDFSRTKRIVEQLHGKGFQVALDDFGTGFSSVGYLRQFNFDRLKIDRSLVEKVLMSSNDQAVLQGTMLLAAALTSHVTAEGVESEEQVDLLRLTGCTEFQGYLFSEPVPAADITRMLQAQMGIAA